MVMKCAICGENYNKSDGTETLDNYFVCLNCCNDASGMKLLDIKKHLIANSSLINRAKRKYSNYESIDNILFYNLDNTSWYIGELGEIYDFADILYVDYNEYLSEEYTGVQNGQRSNILKTMVSVSFSNSLIDDLYLYDKEKQKMTEKTEKNLLVNSAVISIHLINGQIFNYKLNSVPFYYISRAHDSIINAANYIKNVVFLLKEYYYACTMGVEKRMKTIEETINSLRSFSHINGERSVIYVKKGRKTKEDNEPIPEGKKQCPICYEIIDEGLTTCPKCDFEF
jgi:hypothetical protein